MKLRAPKTLIIFFSVFLAMTHVQVKAQNSSSGDDFDRAITEFRGGNYSEAAVLFDRADAAAPGVTDALLYKGKALIHLNDYAGAEGALRLYLRTHRDSGDTMYLLGFVLHRQNRPKESLETYTQAAAIAPPSGDDLKIVGLDYVLLDDYSDAIKWLARAVEMDPKNQDAWYYLGRAYYTKARLPEAQKAFETVLSLHPSDSKAENNLGLIYETGGRTNEAIEAYRKAILWQEKDSRQSAQPYVNLGNLELEQGQAKDALVLLEKAVALAPEDAFCRMKLGIAYRQADRLNDAQRELEKAAQLEPDNPAIHFQLGRLYKQMHMLDRAQAEFDRTAELQSRAAKATPIPDH
jgi:tetratricopeptide (TPR) repeat protein